MNFLAHLYLSGNDEDLIVGNFIADMVKGRQIENFNGNIVKGIKLHRKIDAFTDSHPIVDQSKMRLRNKYRLYSGVIVDMFYDHFLARNWREYSRLPLSKFVRSAYQLLLKNYFLLPVRARNVLPFMIASNWLVNYAHLDKLNSHMQGMARRTPFNSGMENAVEDLKKHYDDFGNEFSAFFPELIAFVERQGVVNQHHFGRDD
jgi:acyl carrier protein phosphodiesterase